MLFGKTRVGDTRITDAGVNLMLFGKNSIQNSKAATAAMYERQQ